MVIGPALYRRWGCRLPLVFLSVVFLCYLPYLGVGAKVFGYLGGYSDEEGLRDGSGLFFWLLLRFLLPAIPDGLVRLYAPAAALALGALGLAVLLRLEERDASIRCAFALALLSTVLMSPHYAWYFVWLVPFLCFIPSPAMLWLTAAAAFLEPIEWPDDFIEASIIYAPFLMLGFCEIVGLGWRTRKKPAERAQTESG